MNRLLFTFFALLLPFFLTAQSAEEPMGLDERINEGFTPISNAWQGIVLAGPKYKKKDNITLDIQVDTLSDLSALQSMTAGLGLTLTDRSIGSDIINLTLETREQTNSVTSALESVPGVIEVGEQKATLPVVLILLVMGAAFFTVYFGFVNIRRFPLSINVVRGKFDDVDHISSDENAMVNVVDGDVKGTIADESQEGEVSHFQALATAVSGTVGLGNIAGVALAIALGGPGATFWMIICGLLGMSTKFVECTLGVKYREVDEDGKVYGGPMYYMTKGLGEMGLGGLGKGLGILFAILCVGASFGGGNAAQSNQAASQLASMIGLTGGSAGTIIGAFLALVVGVVIIGGIKRIAQVTEKIVPLMAAIYVGACLIIIFSNIGYVDDAFGLIFSQAFTPQAGLGGLFGVVIVGFQRAAFSNEAGAGSASIAHSAVKTRYPASEGLVALLEPFIDTVVICTMTALVIIMYNSTGIFEYGQPVVIDGETVEGAVLTSRAFGSVLPWFPVVLTIAIVLFAISTMISWSYYGLQSWMYLFGKSKAADLSYKVIFLLFIIIGAAGDMSAVWGFSDAMILALVFPNMFALFFLFPRVREELNRYLQAIRGLMK